jgi:hypothetical protein
MNVAESCVRWQRHHSGTPNPDLCIESLRRVVASYAFIGCELCVASTPPMSSPSPSIISVPDSESSDFAPSSSGSSAGAKSPKVRRVVTAQTNTKIKNNAKTKASIAVAVAVKHTTGDGNSTTHARSQAIGRRGVKSVKNGPGQVDATENDQDVDADVLGDLEDAVGPSVRRSHSRRYHAVDQVAELQGALLDWFEDVR